MTLIAFCNRYLVLIETLWNVNTDLFNVLDAVYGVLIETLWNVNNYYNQNYC